MRLEPRPGANKRIKNAGRYLGCALASIMVLCLPACSAVNPRKVTAIPSERDFTKLDCKQLEAETARIAMEYKDRRFDRQHGTKRAYAVLNGEVAAVNDAIRINECKLPEARIPGAAWSEQRNDPK
jgi:hypothetical protein